MALGIKTAIRRRLSGPYVNDDYHEAVALAQLSALPAGALKPPPTDGEPLRVAFVVPFFQPGSGGHMTIANIVRGLEASGHACSLWIDDPGRRCKGDPATNLRTWFGPFVAPVSYGTDGIDADVVVATGWQTAQRVRTLPAAGRAYLVQDHEPEFFGTSTQRAAAEASYGLGLYPITAGDWLKELMSERYGLEATAFDLGIDRRYAPQQGVQRSADIVLAYARWSTSRRGVPVAFAALAELHRRRPQTQIWTYGQSGDLGLDFPHVNKGVLPDRELPALYAQATAGLVLSLTNYSLVAQEMLACRLPCVELESPSVVAAFGTSGAVDLAPLDPSAIADRLIALLDDPALRARRAEVGGELRAERTWERAAGQVATGLRAAIEHTQRVGGTT